MLGENDLIRSYLHERFNKKICRVLGFGRSNKPLIRLLLESGALVSVHDANEDHLKDREAQELMSLGAEFVLGKDYLESISPADYIFRTPGIKDSLEEIREAVKSGAALTSEMELFFEVCPCRIIGITGSDGKTTTTTVTHLLLQKEFEKDKRRRVYIGGNIGSPLLPQVFEMQPCDIAVVELSSFQLQTMKRSPNVALITNITPNHLNWHKDMDEYITAKCNICRHEPVERIVLNAENVVTREIAKNSDKPIIYFSSKRSSYSDIVPFFKENCSAVYDDGGVIYLDDGKARKRMLEVKDIRIPGRHNVENYMSAIALTYDIVSPETVKEAARAFGGVEHRIEFVRELDGVKYYNSSIDSSPTRTAAALSVFEEYGIKPLIICGGSDKNVEFDTLASDLCKRARAVILTGQSASKILTEIEKCKEYKDSSLKVCHIPVFKDAVIKAASMAEKGDVVLLSPACASFDAFKDFEDRGKTFKSIVEML